jgi:hypothetical protein
MREGRGQRINAGGARKGRFQESLATEVWNGPLQRTRPTGTVIVSLPRGLRKRRPHGKGERKTRAAYSEENGKRTLSAHRGPSTLTATIGDTRPRSIRRTAHLLRGAHFARHAKGRDPEGTRPARTLPRLVRLQPLGDLEDGTNAPTSGNALVTASLGSWATGPAFSGTLCRPRNGGTDDLQALYLVAYLLVEDSVGEEH